MSSGACDPSRVVPMSGRPIAKVDGLEARLVDLQEIAEAVGDPGGVDRGVEMDGLETGQSPGAVRPQVAHTVVAVVRGHEVQGFQGVQREMVHRHRWVGGRRDEHGQGD